MPARAAVSDEKLVIVHAKVLTETGVMVYVREGELLFVPTGWLALPMYTASKPQQTDAPDFMHLAVQTVIAEDFVKGTLDNVEANAISTLNKDHFDKRGHDPRWTCKKAHFEAHIEKALSKKTEKVQEAK